MGEKISTLGHVIVSEVEYEVELNQSTFSPNGFGLSLMRLNLSKLLSHSILRQRSCVV
jgi:hypothetical protein